MNTAADDRPQANVPLLRTAACITGQFRTLDRECIGPRMCDRVLRPLNADTFVFVKVPGAVQHELAQYHARLRSALHGARIVRLNLTVQSDPAQQPCPSKKRAGSTYIMATDVSRCYEAMQEHTGGEAIHYYAWVLRLRTDLLVHFRMLT